MLVTRFSTGVQLQVIIDVKWSKFGLGRITNWNWPCVQDKYYSRALL